ncbi:unnamed protein product [Peniophora sp. CBMAI 1063]|nr:unnamed protein product [Peniophora sp. CBMAI 1063]
MASTMMATMCIAILALLWKPLRGLYRTFLSPLLSPLRAVPGPPPQNWLYGTVKLSRKLGQSAARAQWVQEYGPVLADWSFFGRQRLILADNRSIGHVLTNSVDYHKPQLGRFFISQIFGEGLLSVEGHEHKRQRRVLNPAFGPAHIRELLPIFFEKSFQLRDTWKGKIAESGSARILVDVLGNLQLTTLDIIGSAGFGLSFDALQTDEETKELTDALRTLTSSDAPGVMAVLQAIVPPLRHIVSLLVSIGVQLYSWLTTAHPVDATHREGSSGVEPHRRRDDVQGKDILSVLVRANLATDLSENERLSDDAILAQIPTFLLAGHETTSSAVAWGLHSLSNDQTIQDKLRTELRDCIQAHGPTPSSEVLNSLPYLERFVREVMRLHSPVTSASRVATKDDVIPTADDWVDIHGVKRSGVPVVEGDTVLLPIEIINHSVAIWGPDAMDFRPERWENPPKAASAIPGVWGNSLSFLGGPHACIGFRFSLLEMKALFFTLVSTLRFQNAVAPEKVYRSLLIVARPAIKGEEDKGARLPVFVSLVDEEVE